MPGPGDFPSDFQGATGPDVNDFGRVIGSAFGRPDQQSLDTIAAGFSDAFSRRLGSKSAELEDAAMKVKNDIIAKRGEAEREKILSFTPKPGPGVPDDPLELNLRTLEGYRASLPDADQAAIPTRDQILERTRETALARYYSNQDTLARSGDPLAKFVGQAGGTLADPVNLASMFLLHYPATSILKTMAIEGVSQTALQASIEPFTYDYMHNDLQLPYDWRDSANNILGAGIGGAGIGGLVRTLEKGVVRGMGGVPIDEREAALRVRRAAQAQEGQDASRVVADVAAHDAENPFVAGGPPQLAEALERHRTETMRADETVQHGAPLTAPIDGPAPALAPRAIVPDQLRELGIEPVFMHDLKRDPDVFQFKDSDQEGVTPALKGVEKWDPTRAGMAIVWENKAGDRYIVDGHQRHALANRLEEGGHPPIVQPAYVLREADGVTPAKASVTAALANIAQGTGTSIDAARVLRGAGPDAHLNLPPNSSLVKEAAGLAHLSHDAFGMVANGANPTWGAMVGRLVPDEELHVQMLDAIEKLNPKTAHEAEGMIRDLVSAPTTDYKQTDLFGTTMVREMLIKERAEVRQAALSLLAKNRTAYRATVASQAELERVGNHLEAAKNRAGLDENTQLALRLEKEGHVKGPISDALNQAAKDLKDGHPLRSTVDRVIEALKKRDSGSGESGAAPGASGRGAERPSGGAAEAAGLRKPEVLDLDLNLSTLRKFETGADKVSVHVNPTERAMAKLSVLPPEARRAGGQASRTVRLRYLRDADGNLYVWRGDIATHEDVSAALKIDIDPAKPTTADTGMIDIEKGRALFDGEAAPAEPPKPATNKALKEGGANAWARELAGDHLEPADRERALGWLLKEKKDVIADVHAALHDGARPSEDATKAAMISHIREALARQLEEAGQPEAVKGWWPPQLPADDEVQALIDAEAALRRPEARVDAGASAAAAARSEKVEAPTPAMDPAADAIEERLREMRKMEETPGGPSAGTYMDPETGKEKAVSALLGEIDQDKQGVERLRACLLPGHVDG